MCVLRECLLQRSTSVDIYIIIRINCSFKNKKLKKQRKKRHTTCQGTQRVKCILTMHSVVVGSHCDVIGCQLARRGVRRGAVEASGSDGVQRVWAVGLTSILDPPQFFQLPNTLLLLPCQGPKVCRYNWHSAGSLGWPFPVLKYRCIFQIKYTEAIL